MTGHRFVPDPGVWRDWKKQNAGFFEKKPQFLDREAWRKQLLENKLEMGISKKTEAAVERGLAWLARHQDMNGGWSGDKFTDRCGLYYGKKCQVGARLGGWDIGMTGISILAFYGAGYRPGQGPYKDTVLRAQVYTAARQWHDGDFGGQEDLRGPQTRRQDGQAAADRGDGDRGGSACGVAPDVHRRLPVRAGLLLRREHARRGLGRAARPVRAAARGRRHALGRELRVGRVHRGAERVAHLSRRRRHGRGPEPRGGHARRRFRPGERRVPGHADRPRGAVGRRALPARRAGRGGEGGGLRPRGERHSPGHVPGTVRRVRRAHERARAAHGQPLPVHGRVADGPGEAARQRHRSPVHRVDRAAPEARGRGHQRPRRLHLRAEHRRGRADRAGEAVHGPVAQGGPDHRRALERRGFALSTCGVLAFALGQGASSAPRYTADNE